MIKERRELVRGLYAYVKRLTEESENVSSYMCDHLDDGDGEAAPADLRDLVNGVFIAVAKLDFECQKYLPEEDVQ